MRKIFITLILIFFLPFLAFAQDDKSSKDEKEKEKPEIIQLSPEANQMLTQALVEANNLSIQGQALIDKGALMIQSAIRGVCSKMEKDFEKFDLIPLNEQKTLWGLRKLNEKELLERKKPKQ